jgi:DNA-binding NarL/FixJ family response regulator
VVILTTFDLDEYVYAALRDGASGFLLKDTPPADLLTAIRVVAAGDALPAPAITRRLIDEFAARATTRPAVRPDIQRLITDRERLVLTLVGEACPIRRSAIGRTSPTAPSKRTSATC